jgi:hypothetical protein
MNWKVCGRKRSWPNLKSYPGFCLYGLVKTTKTLRQDSRSPSRDLKPGLPKYEAGVLITRRRRLVSSVIPTLEFHTPAMLERTQSVGDIDVYKIVIP